MATNKSFGNKQTKPDKFFALLLLLGHTRLPVLGDLVIEIEIFGPNIDKLINFYFQMRQKFMPLLKITNKARQSHGTVDKIPLLLLGLIYLLPVFGALIID